MAGNLEHSSSSSEDSDVLMVDPFLEYINDILMEEGVDDACATSIQQFDSPSYQAILSGFYNILDEHSTPDLDEGVDDAQQVDDVSYQAIFRGFYEILGQHNALPNSYGNSPISHEGVFDPHLLHRSMCSYHENGPSISDRLYGLTGEPHNSGASGIPLPPECHPRSSFLQEQDGYGNLKMDDDFPAKLAEIDVSFEDLKLKSAYTDLYVGEPSPLGSSTRDIKHNRDKPKPLAVAGTGSKAGKKSTSEVQVFVDVREVLVSCAHAVGIGDARRANQILQELRQVHGASANGTGLQRTAHFFSQALEARLRGMGEQQFRAICHNMPSATTFLKASKIGFEVGPYAKVLHYFANQSILKAAEGVSRLHVVDYGLLYGIQWPCLINALADRKEGPPLLVITGIDSPQPGFNMAERLDESGRRLAAYAKTHRVPFQYHAIVSDKWGDIDAASLHLHEGEVVVVNCIKHLHLLPEESADSSSTMSSRQEVLTCMHSLNPHLLITGVVSAAHNSPFFVSRFREALYYYSNAFDMLDTLWGDTSERLIVERRCFYPDILNIVACEGTERVPRTETYKQWHKRITKAGFEQLSIPSRILSRARSHVKQHHHKDYLIEDDANGWMLMGWKGRTTLAVSAWKPSHR